MIMVTSCHTDACFNAWMKCEDVLINLAHIQRSLSKKFMKVIDECALICMSTFHALKSKSVNANGYALLCVGICEECAELCEEFKDENFRECALLCRQCAETMSQFLPLLP